jgi:hypothetical protein
MISHLPLLSIRVLKLLYLREVKLFLSDFENNRSSAIIEKRRNKLFAISSELDMKLKSKAVIIDIS